MPPLDRKRACATARSRPSTGSRRRWPRTDPASLIQLATGAGKTFTACSFSYRLIRHAGAKRILFLVDRNNLGDQTLKEFQNYQPPGAGQPFTDTYIVQHLHSHRIDPDAKVVITTIQRLYSDAPRRGTGRGSGGGGRPSRPGQGEEGEVRPLAYNPAIPIETFDFIVTDECHRSIYGLWRQVLEYFDASIIGLTATPSKHTLGFFNQNLVAEYPYERSVADGVNVGYEVYRIRTRVTEEGGRVEVDDTGFQVPVRDRRTRAVRYEELDADLEYTAQELDRSVVEPQPDPHRAADLQGPGLHRAVPRPHGRVAAQDADLRQGRQPRRGDRPYRPRGVRRGQRLRQEDHLPQHRRGPQGADQGVPGRSRSRASPSPST